MRNALDFERNVKHTRSQLVEINLESDCFLAYMPEGRCEKQVFYQNID
jgi:hypothetical protein